MTRDIRQDVSRAYADALRQVTTSTGSGCCSSSCCEPVSPTALLAGYGDSSAKYADAAASSFGCGNPLALAEVAPGQTVLDLGSGAGLDLLIAADKVGPGGKVIGVDMTDEMLAAARAHAERAGFANVDLRKGFIEALPVDDASVDWVISNCVINLSPQKPRVFAEIARVLRPGGRFSVSDVVADDLPAWVRENAAAYAACVGGAISEREYLAGLAAAGLTDLAVTERRVYDAAEIRKMIASSHDVDAVDPALLQAGVEAMAGKVASVKVVGRRAAAATGA